MARVVKNQIFFRRPRFWLSAVAQFQIIIGALGGIICLAFAFMSFSTFQNNIQNGWTEEVKNDPSLEMQVYQVLMYMVLVTCHALLISWHLIQIRLGVYLTSAVQNQKPEMLKTWLMTQATLIVFDIVRWIPIMVMVPLFIDPRWAGPLVVIFILSIGLSSTFVWIVNRHRNGLLARQQITEQMSSL